MTVSLFGGKFQTVVGEKFWMVKDKVFEGKRCFGGMYKKE